MLKYFLMITVMGKQQVKNEVRMPCNRGSPLDYRRVGINRSDSSSVSVAFVIIEFVVRFFIVLEKNILFDFAFLTTIE
jgi:hypothetical protein